MQSRVTDLTKADAREGELGHDDESDSGELINAAPSEVGYKDKGNTARQRQVVAKRIDINHQPSATDLDKVPLGFKEWQAVRMSWR
jgi:hypothetical protein